jgi:hypothetical protein
MRSVESLPSGVEILHFGQGDVELESNFPMVARLHSVYFYYTDSVAIADELNPLTISHNAINSSFKTIGKYKIIAGRKP